MCRLLSLGVCRWIGPVCRLLSPSVRRCRWVGPLYRMLFGYSWMSWFSTFVLTTCPTKPSVSLVKYLSRHNPLCVHLGLLLPTFNNINIFKGLDQFNFRNSLDTLGMHINASSLGKEPPQIMCEVDIVYYSSSTKIQLIKKILFKTNQTK